MIRKPNPPTRPFNDTAVHRYCLPARPLDKNLLNCRAPSRQPSWSRQQRWERSVTHCPKCGSGPSTSKTRNADIEIHREVTPRPAGRVPNTLEYAPAATARQMQWRVRDRNYPILASGGKIKILSVMAGSRRMLIKELAQTPDLLAKTTLLSFCRNRKLNRNIHGVGTRLHLITTGTGVQRLRMFARLPCFGPGMLDS